MVVWGSYEVREMFLQISGVIFWVIIILVLFIYIKAKYKSKFQRTVIGKFVCYRKYKMKILLGKTTKEKLKKETWLYPTFLNKKDAIKLFGEEIVKEREMENKNFKETMKQFDVR